MGYSDGSGRGGRGFGGKGRGGGDDSRNKDQRAPVRPSGGGGKAGGGWNERGAAQYKPGHGSASSAVIAGRPAHVPKYGPQEDAHSQPVHPKFDELPVWQHADEIWYALEANQVICVQGETGCGKSSVVPMLLRDWAGGGSLRIAVTQPRRLAAMSLAARVASQVGEEVGRSVGYRVAMDGKVSRETKTEFVTTGWLLMHLAHKLQAISSFTHVILDEIHERDLDMDLLCLILKRALPENPSLKIVLMSATVDATKFLDYFAGPGVRVCRDPVVVGSRRFPTWPFFFGRVAGWRPEGKFKSGSDHSAPLLTLGGAP
mmetsp:Transcript_20814/g.46439  ORF Transcript_20814/g.46439 Transcript_20814/m.46439 type:complete len:316 (-) Transcript_20814:3549-4496(-)